MKKPLFHLLQALCVFCLLCACAAAFAEDSLHTLPVEIVSITPGKDAGFVLKHCGTEEITTVSFRIRGTDEAGNPVSFSAEDAESGETAYVNVALFNAPITSILLPGDVRDIRIENGYQSAFSSTLEMALQQYTTLDGKTFRIPESQLCWFSSRDGYPVTPPSSFRYDYPEASVFRKSYSFSLGVSIERIYPEMTEARGVSKPGYLVTGTHGGILAGRDIHAGDLLWAVNGIPIVDDPCAMEKAKAALTDGTDMTLSLIRDQQPLELLVTSGDLIAYKSLIRH
ncbi:MAG: hypothetical protein J6U01_09685 [Clostridia bacterium]|nr:hypothetical protein [Clostridia bacterium]